MTSQVAQILKPLNSFLPNDSGKQEGIRPLQRRILPNLQVSQDLHEQLIEPNAYAGGWKTLRTRLAQEGIDVLH